MSKTIFLNAAAALALVVGLGATASAETQEQARAQAERQIAEAVRNSQAAVAKFKADLAAEEPTVHNAPNNGPYLFTAYNKTDRDIWVTFYKKQWYGDEQVGQACVPPNKSAGVASSSWSTLKARIQVEAKTGLKCGGTNVGQADLLTEGVTVVSGGTSRVTITNTTSPQASFVQ